MTSLPQNVLHSMGMDMVYQLASPRRSGARSIVGRLQQNSNPPEQASRQPQPAALAEGEPAVQTTPVEFVVPAPPPAIAPAAVPRMLEPSSSDRSARATTELSPADVEVLRAALCEGSALIGTHDFTALEVEQLQPYCSVQNLIVVFVILSNEAPNISLFVK